MYDTQPRTQSSTGRQGKTCDITIVKITILVCDKQLRMWPFIRQLEYTC